MPIAIVPYEHKHIDAVKQFNQRLSAKGITMRFPETEAPNWLPKVGNREIYQEYFLAMDGDIVRGGYILKHQQFELRGERVDIGNYQLPISEGIIDTRFGYVALSLLSDAIRRQPLLYCLGLGGYEQPITRLLQGMGWEMVLVPFYFKVLRPAKFLRQISFLRSTPFRRLLLDTLALSGIGWAMIKFRQLLQRRLLGLRAHAAANIGPFESWADRLWQDARSNFVMSAIRDGEVMDILYPESDNRFKKTRETSDGRTVGWTVSLVTQMSNHKFFGNMKVASVVDCLSLAGYERMTLSGCLSMLAGEKPDLIVTNQSNSTWCRAFEHLGFLLGPSNFVFAVSPQLAARLGPLAETLGVTHLNRGDGDGPIHL